MTEENRELTKLVENALSYRRETDDRLATMAKKVKLRLEGQTSSKAFA